MANSGAWPIDPSTPEGLFRIQIGDVVGTPHSPADNMADFEFMSDDAIDAIIAAYPVSINMAKASAIQSMAIQLIASAQDIQVDDIKIKTIERAQYMLQMASALTANALLMDASIAFQVVPLTIDPPFESYPAQGTPFPWNDGFPSYWGF